MPTLAHLVPLGMITVKTDLKRPQRISVVGMISSLEPLMMKEARYWSFELARTLDIESNKDNDSCSGNMFAIGKDLPKIGSMPPGLQIGDIVVIFNCNWWGKDKISVPDTSNIFVATNKEEGRKILRMVNDD